MSKKSKVTEDQSPLDMDSPYVKEINAAGFVVLSEFVTCGATHRLFVRPDLITLIWPDTSCARAESQVWINCADDILVQETPGEIMTQVSRVNSSRVPF